MSRLDCRWGRWAGPGRGGAAGEPLTRVAWLVCLLAGAPLLPAIAAQSRMRAPAATPVPPPLRAAPADVRAPPLVSWPLNRYLWFSNVANIPPVRISTQEQLVRIGQSATLPLQGLSTLSDVEAKGAAGELGVPTRLIVNTARAASQAQTSSPDFPRQLRSAVIDFRFLLAELTCYHPAGDQSAKTNALLALLDGDLPKVWEFYRSLQWPATPATPGSVATMPQASR